MYIPFVYFHKMQTFITYATDLLIFPRMVNVRCCRRYKSLSIFSRSCQLTFCTRLRLNIGSCHRSPEEDQFLKFDSQKKRFKDAEDVDCVASLASVLCR